MHPAPGDLEARVAEAVQAHRPELAALVHERVAAEVDKLVAELVAAELEARRNGQRLCVECGTRSAQRGRRGRGGGSLTLSRRRTAALDVRSRRLPAGERSTRLPRYGRRSNR